MLDGFAYLVGQVAGLLVIAVVLGVLVGHYAWPRRSAAGHGAAARGAPTVAPTSSPPVAPTQSDAPPAPSVRGPATEPIPVGARSTPARSTPAGPIPGGPAGTERDEEMADLARKLQSSRAEVIKLQAQALRLRADAAAVADTKDAEMGRLESGAIEALDSLIASHAEQLSVMQARTDDLTARAKERELDLEEERRRTLHLQAALAERDERLAVVLAQVIDRDHQIDALRAAQP